MHCISFKTNKKWMLNINEFVSCLLVETVVYFKGFLFINYDFTKQNLVIRKMQVVNYVDINRSLRKNAEIHF